MSSYSLAIKVNEAARELRNQLRLYSGYLSDEIEYSQVHGQHDLADELHEEMKGVEKDIVYLDKFVLHE